MALQSLPAPSLAILSRSHSYKPNGVKLVVYDVAVKWLGKSWTLGKVSKPQHAPLFWVCVCLQKRPGPALVAARLHTLLGQGNLFFKSIISIHAYASPVDDTLGAAHQLLFCSLYNIRRRGSCLRPPRQRFSDCLAFRGKYQDPYIHMQLSSPGWHMHTYANG